MKLVCNAENQKAFSESETLKRRLEKLRGHDTAVSKLKSTSSVEELFQQRLGLLESGEIWSDDEAFNTDDDESYVEMLKGTEPCLMSEQGYVISLIILPCYHVSYYREDWAILCLIL